MSCRHFAQQEYFHWIGMRSNCVIQFSPLLLLLHRQLGMFIFRCIVQDVLHSPCMAKSSCPLFTEEEHAQFAKKIYDLVSDTRYNQWWDCYHPQPEDKSVCETKTLLHDTIQTANSLAFHRLDTTVRLCMVSDLLYCWLMAHTSLLSKSCRPKLPTRQFVPRKTPSFLFSSQHYHPHHLSTRLLTGPTQC